VSAVVVAPITEELIFRLLLQGWLERLEMLRQGVLSPPSDARPSEPIAGFASAADALDMPPPPAAFNPYQSPAQAAQHSATAAAGGNSTALRPGWFSLFTPALLFALVHGWPDCLPLFVFALALGYLYRQTHRIVPCIVLHACLNGGSMFLLWLDLS
jgi:hypothetical protein